MIKGNVAACPDCNCISKRRLLELLNLIPSQCNPLQSSIITATPKRVVTVTQPNSVIADGNTVYVAEGDANNGFVSKFDQDGNLLATFGNDVFPRRPRKLEVRGGNLYATAFSASNGASVVFVKSTSNDTDQFRVLVNLPHLITYARFTPNGRHILITVFSTNMIIVYNLDFTVNTTVTIPSGAARDIHFDTCNNVYITNRLSEIYVYNEGYAFDRTITYPEANTIDAWLFQCDGSKILVDLAGKVIFVDKDDNIQVHTDGFADVTGVAVTDSGALFISDRDNNKLFIY